LAHFEQFVGKVEDSSVPPSVFCPLAGDDPMVHLLWKRGYSVTSIDLVPTAVEALKGKFKEGSWTKMVQDGGQTTAWLHDSGRATLYVGDALRPRAELVNKFDAMYDKDSFGALKREMRTGFCKRISEYCKNDALVYIEVKLKDNHEEVKDIGPPFSLKKEDLMDEANYGSSFSYVAGLGPVYKLSMPSMQQTGHIIKKR